MKREAKDTHVYFPVKVLTDLKKMAAQSRRSMSAEIVLAVEEKVREWKLREQNGKSRISK